MAFLEGIAGYVERKGSKKRRHKTESGQRYSLNSLMNRFGFNPLCATLSPIGTVIAMLREWPFLLLIHDIPLPCDTPGFKLLWIKAQ